MGPSSEEGAAGENRAAKFAYLYGEYADNIHSHWVPLCSSYLLFAID